MRVIPLDEAVDRMYSGSLPQYAVAITVDDGFHSFYSLAAPRLARHSFPATVYVTTYYVRKGVPIFRLVVQYMFWKTTRKTVFLRGVPWSETVSIDLTNLAEVERTMWACIEYAEQKCTEAQRQEICRNLGELLGVPFELILENRSFHLMSENELRSLESADISVGLHTHRHCFPENDRERAVREILENRQELEGLTRKVVPHFCYPSGIWREHEGEWLDGLGVKSSTTCMPGLNSAATPRHALHRYLDGDNVHSVEFEAALCGMMDILHRVLALFTKRVAT